MFLQFMATIICLLFSTGLLIVYNYKYFFIHKHREAYKVNTSKHMIVLMIGAVSVCMVC